MAKAGALVKTEEQKYVNEWIDALTTKIMDNEASRAHSWKHARTKNGIYHNFRFAGLKMLEIAAKHVSVVLRRSRWKLSSKINVYLHGEITENKTSGKKWVVREKVYKNTEKYGIWWA